MKAWKKFIGVAEIILALVATGLAITSKHPQAWFGFVLAVMFGSKGLLLLLDVGENKSEGVKETEHV